MTTQIPARPHGRTDTTFDPRRPAPPPTGSRIIAVDFSGAVRQCVVLTSDFAVAGPAHVSSDGRKLLFVGARDEDGFTAVWEKDLVGGAIRRVVAPHGGAVSAIYLSTLYTIDADKPERHIAFCSVVPDDDIAQLFICKLDGSNVRQITFTPDGAWDPLLLSDGRLIFASAVLHTSGRRNATRLMAVNTDGTDVFPFTAFQDPQGFSATPFETPDGRVIFVERFEAAAGFGAWDRGGAIVSVSRTRSLLKRIVVADDDIYHSPTPLGEGLLLVSCKGESETYGLSVLDYENGERFALYDDPQWHEVSASVIVPREMPVGRSSIVDEARRSGVLYCFDAYLNAQRRLPDDGPHRIDRMRILTPGDRSPKNSPDVLGVVPVHPDGSFLIELPAKTPLRLQALNAAGRIVREMTSWMWVMPGENRGCIGCHEDRELAPPNRFVSALMRKPQRIGPDESAAHSDDSHSDRAPYATPRPVQSDDDRHRPTDDRLAEFIGHARCEECHGVTHPNCSVRPVSAHAESFYALRRPEAEEIASLCGIADAPPTSRICLSCHGTGADEGPRWWQASFRLTEGVRCEACHGPGSLHEAAARGAESNPETLIRPGSRAACDECHVERPSHKMVLVEGYRTPKQPRSKTPVNLVVSPVGDQLLVVCQGSDTLLVVDTATGTLLREIKTGRQPQDVALSPDGGTIYVSNRRDDDVTVIDAVSMCVTRRITVGDEPHGLLTDSSGQLLFVLNTEADSISIVETQSPSDVRRLAAGRGPWSLARRDGDGAILVTSVRPDQTRFQDPPVSEVTVLSPNDHGERRYVVTDRIQVPGANMLQGIAVVPGHEAALLTLMRTKNRVPITRLGQGWTITNGLGVLHADGRVDQVLLDRPNDSFPDPMDIAVRPDGRYALVTSGGANCVAVVDVESLLSLLDHSTDDERARLIPNHLGLSDQFVVKRIEVGTNPRGVTFSSDGKRAYVANALDDTVSVIDGQRLEAIGTIDLGGPETITELRRGEQLFHDAGNAFGQQFSCRSCHPDGHVNGLTFDIEADGVGIKPVDNRTLRGILDTAPFKWEGINPSLQRQCGPRLAVFFTRLDPYTPDELDALVRYECSIRRPPNRYRDPKGLTPSQRRGKAVFERAHTRDGREIPVTNRCPTCHAKAYGASPTPSNVGTTMWLDGPVDPLVDDLHAVEDFGYLGIVYFHDTGTSTQSFDVPHLINVYNSSPYLHNGSAATLEEVWTRFNHYDEHGVTSDLTRREFNDLIAYLKAL